MVGKNNKGKSLVVSAPRSSADDFGAAVHVPKQIEMVRLTALVFADVMLRNHPNSQLRKLGKNIRKFGFLIPIIIDQDNVIVAGEARVKAAQTEGLTHAPAIRVKHLTDPELRAFRIADNRLSDLSSFHNPNLVPELVQLSEIIEINFTGFVTPEVDLLIKASIAKPTDVARDDCPPANFGQPAVARLDDIFRCGDSRVACGNSLDPTLMNRLMGHAQAAQLLSDPPYNLKISGNVSGLGKIKHAEFAMASGEMSEEEFFSFLKDFLSHASRHCKDGAIFHVFSDWRHVHQLIEAGLAVGLQYFQFCTWAKTNGSMGSFYRNQTECVVVFKSGSAPHTNNIQLGKYGRNRTNLWCYEGANSINPKRRKELALHPTVKPALLCMDAILDCTHRGEIVLDPYLGSGSTLIGAHECGRRCYGIEISPHYVDVEIRRWQEFSGEKAILEITGQTFDELVKERSNGVRRLPPPN